MNVMNLKVIFRSVNWIAIFEVSLAINIHYEWVKINLSRFSLI